MAGGQVIYIINYAHFLYLTSIQLWNDFYLVKTRAAYEYTQSDDLWLILGLHKLAKRSSLRKDNGGGCYGIERNSKLF